MKLSDLIEGEFFNQYIKSGIAVRNTIQQSRADCNQGTS